MVELREFDRADSITVTTIRPNTTVTPSAITSANPCSSWKSRRNRVISGRRLFSQFVVVSSHGRFVDALIRRDVPEEKGGKAAGETAFPLWNRDALRSGELPGEGCDTLESTVSVVPSHRPVNTDCLPPKGGVRAGRNRSAPPDF